MDTIFIFGAKYLLILSIIIALWIFYKADRALKKRMVIFGILSMALSMAIALVLRHFYFNPRPFVMGNFVPLIPHAADNGFPSDHVLLVAAIASVFTFIKRKYAWLLWVITILVAISRVYVGVHHTLDVSASIIIALVSACIVHIVLERRTSAIIVE